MAKSKSIKYINWAKDIIDSANADWILPQLLAAIGNYWPITKGDNGLYSFTETLRLWKQTTLKSGLDLEGSVQNLEDVQAVMKYLCLAPRGEVLGSMRQTSVEGLRYSAPVPLILSSWKQYRGVGYSQWDWKDPNRRFFLDSDILEWSDHFGEDVAWSRDDLLQFRVTALEVKSGSKQGTVRKPESCSSVFGVTDKDFKALPRLMKLSLCQLWCFHPSLRTDLMITDHVDLDSHPDPLVDGEIVTPKSKALATGQTTSDSPWDV